MDKKPAAVIRSLAQWDKILADYQESGQSIRAFCRAQGIGLSSFYAHKNGARSEPRTPKAFGVCQQRCRMKWVRQPPIRALDWCAQDWCAQD